MNREESTEGWGALRSCTDCTAAMQTSDWFGFGWSWGEAGGLTGWSVIAAMLEGTCCPHLTTNLEPRQSKQGGS